MSDAKHEVIEHAETLPLSQGFTHPLAERILAAHPTPEALRELMAMQREWQADVARRAYQSALVELTRDLPRILHRDATVDYTNKEGRRTFYKHTSLAHALDEITPHLINYGFSLTWETESGPAGVKVTAKLGHRAGHTGTSVLTAPPDPSGNKSAPQAVASTVTLLSRYTGLALLGIATADMDEPQGHQTTTTDAVDSKANLALMGELKKNGKTLAEAEGHVGKNIKEWTAKDCETLKAWIAGYVAGAHVAPVIKTMQGTVQKRVQRQGSYVVTIADVEYVTQDQDIAAKCIGEVVIEYNQQGEKRIITGVKS